MLLIKRVVGGVSLGPRLAASPWRSHLRNHIPLGSLLADPLAGFVGYPWLMGCGLQGEKTVAGKDPWREHEQQGGHELDEGAARNGMGVAL